jgi:hypothetical protein
MVAGGRDAARAERDFCGFMMVVAFAVIGQVSVRGVR